MGFIFHGVCHTVHVKNPVKIQITKGHDIRISGTPKREIVSIGKPEKVALKPIEFRGVKPKLLVKEKDKVKRGQPLFFDKQNPEVTFASPGSGTVSAVNFGPKRSIETIEISLDGDDAVEHEPVRFHAIASIERENIKSAIMKGGLWPLIKQRPFNGIADPGGNPKAIFISGFNSAPLAVDIDLALSEQSGPFQAGLNVLSTLTDGDVHLTVSEGSVSETMVNAERVRIHYVNGPHPAGNVGIQIHHIDPLNPGEIIWTVAAQSVVTLGTFFTSGEYDPSAVFSVGGPSINNPVHVNGIIGMNVGSLLKDRLTHGPARIISGDVLTGKEISPDGFMGYYDTTVSVIPDSDDREFLGLLRPGTSDTRYSLTNAFLSSNSDAFHFTNQTSGSKRPMVPIDAWEKVLPMDIYANALYRAILAGDFDEMEGLGLIECDEEDFALCSFSCPSKIDVGSVIRMGLDMMEKEG